MLLHCVSFEAMWYLIKEIFSKSTWSKRILASFRINWYIIYNINPLHMKHFDSISSLTCSCWSLNSPKASMIKPWMMAKMIMMIKKKNVISKANLKNCCKYFFVLMTKIDHLGAEMRLTGRKNLHHLEHPFRHRYHHQPVIRHNWDI